MNRMYAYLRASTEEQDATRAKSSLKQFARSMNVEVSAWFIENLSGATLKRPGLFRLLEIAQRGDSLLVEQVDRISRLNAQDWTLLKSQILLKGINIVALDLPTSYQFIHVKNDEFTQRMFAAINSMMLDMLAAFARKDYEDRRRRQSEGISKAKASGKYKGRARNMVLRRNIKALLKDNITINVIASILKCSNKTVISVKKEMEDLHIQYQLEASKSL